MNYESEQTNSSNKMNVIDMNSEEFLLKLMIAADNSFEKCMSKLENCEQNKASINELNSALNKMVCAIASFMYSDAFIEGADYLAKIINKDSDNNLRSEDGDTL